MKKIQFLVLFLIGSFSISNAQTVKIKGKLRFDEQPQMAFLSFRHGEDLVKDSAVIQNGKFNFKATLLEPVLANLSVRFPKKESEKRAKSESMQIFLEPGDIKIDVKDSMKLAEIKGSKAQAEYEVYMKLIKPYTDRQAAFWTTVSKASRCKR